MGSPSLPLQVDILNFPMINYNKEVMIIDCVFSMCHTNMTYSRKLNSNQQGAEPNLYLNVSESNDIWVNSRAGALSQPLTGTLSGALSGALSGYYIGYYVGYYDKLLCRLFFRLLCGLLYRQLCRLLCRI